MPTVADVSAFLERFAPPALAADWDNVGLLLGDPAQGVTRIMTCLTLTPATVAEATRERAELVVAHHPLLFRPIQRITTQSHDGRLLWNLARAGVSVYSPHTAFDSCARGINQQLAEGLRLTDIRPLVETEAPLGDGRCGRLAAPISLKQLADKVKAALHISGLHTVGHPDRACRQVAVACGSAGELIPAAHACGCDVLLTGEARFHACLEAEAAGLSLLLAGHYATERPGVEQLAQVLSSEFPELDAWASREERDPLAWW